MTTAAADKLVYTDSDVFLKKYGYQVRMTIGEGTYSKVKKAYSEKHEKSVAVKIINRRKIPNDFETNFLPREIEILKHVDHPNIAKCYEMLEYQHKLFLVMEFAGHGDLLEYLKLTGALKENKARFWFHQLCQAIVYLHKHKIAHRDLKCENLLLDADGNIKVTDFSFARFFEDTKDMSDTFCGSVAYASPEILKGDKYQPMQHDLWALGVILFIMIFGSMPFDDSSVHKMLSEQTKKGVTFTSISLGSTKVRDLIRHILEANLHQRYSLKQIMQHVWLKGEGNSPETGGPSGIGTRIFHHNVGKNLPVTNVKYSKATNVVPDVNKNRRATIDNGPFDATENREFDRNRRATIDTCPVIATIPKSSATDCAEVRDDNSGDALNTGTEEGEGTSNDRDKHSVPSCGSVPDGLAEMKIDEACVHHQTQYKLEKGKNDDTLVAMV